MPRDNHQCLVREKVKALELQVGSLISMYAKLLVSRGCCPEVLKCRGLLQNYNLLRGRDINDPMLMFIFAEYIKDVFFFGVLVSIFCVEEKASSNDMPRYRTDLINVASCSEWRAWVIPLKKYASEVEFSPDRIKEILREDIAFFRQPNHRHPQASRGWNPSARAVP
ncbi:hypothetical protein NWF32_10755 [Pseudomonas qingdaonensis]|nr:hypothetical protein [Pseudomonas qingdaonensis]